MVLSRKVHGLRFEVQSECVCVWMFLVWIQACFCTDSHTSTLFYSLNFIHWIFCSFFFFLNFKFLVVFCIYVFCELFGRIYRQLLKVNWLVQLPLHTSLCVHVWACISLYTLGYHEKAGFQRPVKGFKGLANEQVIFLQISMNSRLIFCAYVRDRHCRSRTHV